MTYVDILDSPLFKWLKSCDIKINIVTLRVDIKGSSAQVLTEARNDMKEIMKQTLSDVGKTKVGGQNVTKDKPHSIRLKAVTNKERQSLRISSYRYILP